jgi:hypothetical protein
MKCRRYQDMMKCVVNKLERLTKEKERRDGEKEERGDGEKEERWRKLKRGSIYMKCSITGQEKGDLSIQVTG